MGMGDEYRQFLDRKIHHGAEHGFDPVWVPDFLFDFQRALVEWACRLGRCAIFADCGLGKTPMQLVWAENVRRKTGGRVLIVTPLAVGYQTVREAEKFGIEAVRSSDGKPRCGITVTNYEQLHHFTSDDYAGVICDESSILKNFDGSRKALVTEFMRTRPYRLLCTATAAPNDYIELGTSSEALGNMGHMDMLTRFFRNVENTASTRIRQGTRTHQEIGVKFWRFKHHAEVPFWRWVCSWARALRRPSDLGFDDADFILPGLIEVQTTVPCSRPLHGKLFVEPAVGLKEQRDERRATIRQRCEAVAEKLNRNTVAVAWCHLNEEGDLLEKIIDGAVQVKGSMSDEQKEEAFMAFSRGDVRVLVTKPKIGAFGLNWQHCAHMTFFPSHSYEQYYQAVRRCWRFGQTREVTVDIITTDGEHDVLANLQRKATAADRMFSALVAHMNDALHLRMVNEFSMREEVPSWL